MTNFNLTDEEIQKFNHVFSHCLLADVVKTLQSDEYIRNHVKVLAEIEGGHEYTMDEVCDELGLPEWAVRLFAEVRNSDRRTATTQQNLTREALGSANEFLEKCKATKH